MPPEALLDWWTAWRAPEAWIGLPAINCPARPLLRAGVEHRAWVVGVGKRIDGDGETVLPWDHRECRFGQWLQIEMRASHGADETFQTIDALHQRLHILALELLELLELRSQGRGAKALARLGEFHALRDALLTRLRERMRGDGGSGEPSETPILKRTMRLTLRR